MSADSPCHIFGHTPAPHQNCVPDQIFPHTNDVGACFLLRLLLFFSSDFLCCLLSYILATASTLPQFLLKDPVHFAECQCIQASFLLIFCAGNFSKEVIFSRSCYPIMSLCRVPGRPFGAGWLLHGDSPPPPANPTRSLSEWQTRIIMQKNLQISPSKT